MALRAMNLKDKESADSKIEATLPGNVKIKKFSVQKFANVLRQCIILTKAACAV